MAETNAILKRMSLKEFTNVFGSKVSLKRAKAKDGRAFCFFTIGTEDVMCGPSIQQDVENGHIPSGNTLQVLKTVSKSNNEYWTLCKKGEGNAEVLDANVSFNFE